MHTQKHIYLDFLRENNTFELLLENSTLKLTDYMMKFVIDGGIKPQTNIDIINKLKELIALDRDANETIYKERLKGASGLDDLEIVGLGKNKDRIKISIPGINGANSVLNTFVINHSYGNLNSSPNPSLLSFCSAIIKV